MNRLFVALTVSSVLFCLTPTALQADKLILVAGGGTKAGPALATQAKLNGPFGVDFDKLGNMYIVDYGGHQVHKVDAKGTLTTIAGNGKKGDGGDGGLAIKAQFNSMHGLAVLPDGNLCLADTYNNRLRKLEVRSGVVTNFAGNGKKGFGGDGGPAIQASFGNVYCVANDPRADNLFIADLDNRRIRKINLATMIVTSVAGNGQKGVPKDGSEAIKSPLLDPRAVAADRRGNLWILERNGHALRVVDAGGRIFTVAGTGKAGNAGDGGNAVKAMLNSPKHLCVDLDGNVIIADSGNHVVRKYIVAEGKIVRVAGTGVKGAAGAGGDPLNVQLDEPHGVAVHPLGALFIVDSNNQRVLKVEK